MTKSRRAGTRTADRASSERSDWRVAVLARLRKVIETADPHAIEEQKWKKPSNPAGVPVWSHDGMICLADTLKNAVRLTFPKGAQFRDPQKLFNTRLDSRTVRAIDFHEGEPIDVAALTALVHEAVALNTASARKRSPAR